MALTLIQRFLLLGQFRIQRYPPVGRISIARVLTTSNGGQPLCAACPCASYSVCIRRPGCRKLHSDRGVRSLSTTVKEPFLVASNSFGVHGCFGLRLHLTEGHRSKSQKERDFQRRLGRCSSSQQIFSLLGSVQSLSGTMAAAALHRVADLEQEGDALRDPTVLDNDTIRAICFQLEQDSVQLTDAVLVSALLACTRLFLDPWSTLMVRLVSESQDRLDRRQLSVEQLSTLGQAMLAMEGPACSLLEQVMEQIQKQNLALWSLADLITTYRFLEGPLGRDGKYRDLLNAMHAHTVNVTNHMDPSAISSVLGSLVSLKQMQALSLVFKLCIQAAKHVRRFTDQELTVVLGALVYFGQSANIFVTAMEDYVPTMAFTSDPETVTKVMQFFSRRKILSPPVMDAVAESFVYRADDYNTSQVARQIMAFGKLGYLPPNAGELFRKVETILHSRLSHFQPKMLLNLLHSCTLVERFPVNFVSKVFCTHFLQQLQEQGTGLDRIVLAQLTQLNITLKLECPFYQGPELPRNYCVKSFLQQGRSLETPVDINLENQVKKRLVQLLGARSYFGSKVLTQFCYTIDVQIKLDEEGYVLPACQFEDVHKKIAVCIDGRNRFSTNTRQLLGKEAIKQRHLRLLGYEVVQIPYYEFEHQDNLDTALEYLHQKIFPHTFRHKW